MERTMVNVGEAVLVIVFCLILLVGLIGNCLVIYVYGFSKRRRFIKFEKLTLFLGIADLSSCVTNALLYIYYTVYGYADWKFGEFGCKAITSIGPTLANFSLGIVLIISIDRCKAIASPFKSQYSLNLIYCASLIALVLSIISILPYTVHQHLVENDKCQMVFNKWSLSLNIFVFISTDTLFTLIFVFTTTKIFLSIKRSQRTSPVTQQVDKHVTRNQKGHLRVGFIILGMGLIIMFCVFPRDIYLVSFYYSQLHPPNLLSREDHRFVLAITKIFHTANHCVNATLYLIVNSTFRADVIKLLWRIFLCRKRARRIDRSETTTNADP